MKYRCKVCGQIVEVKEGEPCPICGASHDKLVPIEEEKMGELNAFILQYEASKKVAAEKEQAAEEKEDKQPEKQTENQPEKEKDDKPTEAESNNTAEKNLDIETIVRINVLYHDAEMSVEQISSKTGVSKEQIEKVIG